MSAYGIYLTGPGKTDIREVQVIDPALHEVQIQCLANGICMGDVSMFTGKQHLGDPRIIGHEGIGVVTKVGSHVNGFSEGDYVDCLTWQSVQNIPAERVSRFTRPPGDAAIWLTEPVSCIVTALYSYDITPGDRVLVLGAGYMGLLNVQGLARYPLAELVVSDLKPRNLELALEYGATEVIQAGSPEGEGRLNELKAQPFDLVIEASAAAPALEAASWLTRPGGRLAIFSWHHERRALDLGAWHVRGLKVLNAAPYIGLDRSLNSMQRAAALIERGIFDATKLTTHRHNANDVQQALEVAAARPDEYIKGVLEFE